MAQKWVRQVLLLLWKNFILQIRRPVGTTFEIIVPVVFSAILILARVGLEGTSADKCFRTFESNNDRLGDYSRFAVYPNTSWAAKIINGSATLQKVFVSHDLSGKPFQSEDEAAREASNHPYKYSGAVIFQNVDSEELPKLVSYKIRQRRQFDLDTSRVYPQFQVPGPRDYSGYVFQFVPLQKELDKTIIRLQTEQSDLLSVGKETQFPYPAYRVDPFMTVIKALLPIIFVVAFIYTAVCIIREIIREKRDGLKEAMKMMGLSNWVHWFSWFMKNFIFLTISCVLLTILLKAAKIFEYTDGTLLFVFFLSYSFSVVFFCFAISVFSCNVICGMLVGAILWILSYVPYAVIASGTNSRYEIMTTAQKAAACLLPNTCLGIGIQVLAKFEISQIGGQWSNISTVPSIEENFTLLLVIAMFFAQSVVWWIITWYVEAVFPGQFGVPKPFYFFLTSAYWCGTTKSCGTDRKLGAVEEDHFTSDTEPSDVESPPEGCEVGVNIRGLRKVFKTSTGKRVAVDGLNLKIYKGQITALLGHNGAGKTTTISILTGLYTPTKGTATIDGRDIRTDMDRIRENLGLCPQHNVLFDRLTVQEHLEFFIALKGISSKEAKPKIDAMLMDIQLLDKRNARACTLSGGMKRKLCCAIALIGDPEIVFLDEPTSGMDPYARRATWNLLEKYSKRATIILTTHFMDEADYLGDRIAIMANGQLRCCGTSLYLKKKFGIGYRMTLVKNPQFFNATKITQMIEQILPNAKIDSDTSTEKSYILEHKTSQKFRDLFEKLEEHKDELGVQSFGVSITTLEEVFLKVGEETAAVDDTTKVLTGDELVTCNENEKLTGMNLRLAQFRAMFAKRFINSLREKKAVFTQLVLPLVVILGGLALGKVTSLQSEKPALTLDLSMLSNPGGRTYAYVADYRNQSTNWKNWTQFMNSYFDAVRVSPKFITPETLKIRKMNLGDLMTYKGRTYNLSKDGIRSCCNYQDLVLNSKCKDALNTTAKFKMLCGANDKTFGYSACAGCIDGSSLSYSCPMSVPNTILQKPSTIYNEYVLEQSNSKRFFNKYVAGITFRDNVKKGTGPISVDGWYSNQALHTLPSMVNAVNNIILKFLKNNDAYGIKAISHPLPLSDKEKENAAVADTSSIVLSIFATLTASFISASFVVFIISERASKAKHIQFISGVNGTIYWLATFCWDIINYLVPAALIMISFAAFQDSFIKGNDLAVLCFTIFLFGFGMLPFSYLLSFIFKSPFVAYAVISLLGFVISVAMFFGVFVCRFQGSTCSSAAPIMHKVFLLIPMYGFSSSIVDVKQNIQNRAYCSNPKNIQECLRRGTKWHESSLAFEYPGVGLTCVYFIIQFFIFLTLVILIEENFFITIRPKPAPPRPMQAYEDDDVKNEKQHVAYMTPDGIRDSAVVIRDLTKIYSSNNITAVDAVSVVIPKGQCFGLLGVNGAGKTTTFSMLTGELGITGGTAYLSGFNIQQQLREVQKRIGYCPQFDALLPHLTGREMLEMFARLRGIPSDMIPDVVNAALYQLNLNKYADKMCGTYSGGNKRKLSAAIAIVGDPPVLFLDEPTSGMDPVSRRFLWNALTSILENSDRSIILTSHSMEECEALCNRLVIMVNGEFKCIGSLQHLKNRFGQGYMLSIQVGGREVNAERRSSRRRYRSVSIDEQSGIILNEIESPQPTEESVLEEDPLAIQASTEKVKEFIDKYFSPSYLIEERPGMLQYQIMNTQLKWSYMFGTLEDNAANMNITNYSISQTTLEQVFVNFARYQRAEMVQKKKCCCCTC